MNFSALDHKYYRQFALTDIPFLTEQLHYARAQQPWRGLKLLHNIPLTTETLLKLRVLQQGGAEVFVMSPSFMAVEQQLLADFILAGGRWISDLDALAQSDHSFDICLDCAGELINHVVPSIGTVEITGSGSNRYRQAEVNYPVISVDLSTVKVLEAKLGTGEAFVRALKQLQPAPLSQQKFMIFGFGKVGQGIAHYLQPLTDQIWVVDTQPELAQQATEQGLHFIHADDTETVERLAADMFCVVTATGHKEIISSRYQAQAFKNTESNTGNNTAPLLANMGGEDEFGPAFSELEVMCDKKPINFFIEQPTKMRYLDPVFYAHNMGVDLLLQGEFSPGLHAFPQIIADDIVQRWQDLHQESLHQGSQTSKSLAKRGAAL